jgi:hypothetical protein
MEYWKLMGAPAAKTGSFVEYIVYPVKGSPIEIPGKDEPSIVPE